MPNSPQAGSEMLNNMVASFTASNQIGEEMKKAKKAKGTKCPVCWKIIEGKCSRQSCQNI